MNIETQQNPIGVSTDLETLRPVARGNAQYLTDCALVLEAMGIDHNQTETTLLVNATDEDKASAHLRAYLDENKNWPLATAVFPKRQTNQPPTVLMIGAIALFFQITGNWEISNPWFQAGAIDSGRIFNQGEWWRLFTALTLHADITHLMGNCLIGGLMVHLLCKTIGSGSAWLMLLLAGASGNLLNIIFRSTPHHSVGFSTAVFATIGIFTGLKMQSQKFSIMNIILPLGAGMGLLAFLGTEGAQTDLGAHLFGFGCGIFSGRIITATGLAKITHNQQVQRIMLTCAIMIILTCWWLAARSSEVPLM